MNFYCINVASATERWKQVSARFAAEGISVTRFNGWDNSIAGLVPTHCYEVDDPGSGFRMGWREVGPCISHWMLWNYLSTRNEDSFFVFEDDVIFTPGWKEKWELDLIVLPTDWDLFYVGHCCFEGWPSTKISETIYRAKIVHCTHAYMVRAKALPVLLEKCQKVWAPIDLSLVFQALPHLNVFARVPRLMEQEGTVLPK